MSMFEEEFRAFALAEAREPLPRDPILFYGSSSIRLWTSLAQDFAGIPLVNRAFGGSTLRECVEEMNRLVFPVEPRAIVLYAGDNDLDHGASPEDVKKHFEEFVAQVDDHLGLVPLVFISIKASPIRFWNVEKIRHANALVRDSISHWPQAHYLDVFTHMVQPDGARPLHELYGEDGLHLSSAGYHLWATQVRACLSELRLHS